MCFDVEGMALDGPWGYSPHNDNTCNIEEGNICIYNV